jgi:hypothetical protein
MGGLQQALGKTGRQTLAVVVVVAAMQAWV